MASLSPGFCCCCCFYFFSTFDFFEPIAYRCLLKHQFKEFKIVGYQVTRQDYPEIRNTRIWKYIKLSVMATSGYCFKCVWVPVCRMSVSLIADNLSTGDKLLPWYYYQLSDLSSYSMHFSKNWYMSSHV